MAVEYAVKYSDKVDEKFSREAVTNGAVNQDYDWLGVSTVKVYSVGTASLGNYSLTGTSRYGTPAELDNSAQELTLTQDKAFTYTIDRKSNDDGMMVMEAGKSLARQISEVIIPTIDKYRISKMVAGAGNTYTKQDSDTPYAAFLKVNEMISDDLAPINGRVCFCTNAFYSQIKLDDAFVKKGDMAQEIAINGVVGAIDGVYVIPVPASYMPENVAFVITNPVATVSPIKLQEYKVHDNAPGISGWLVEGRVRYDAFVLDNKANAIGVYKLA